VADNVFDAVIHDFVRYRNRLFRVAGIIIFYDLQLFAFDAAFGINIGNSLFCASKLLVAVLRYRTGHCANHGHFDVSLSHGAERQRDTSCQ